MTNNLKYIEHYFDGTLSLEEQQAFNLKIQNEKTFAQDVSFYLKSKNLAKIEQKNRFLELNKQQGRQKKIFLLSTFAAAASLILVIFLFIRNDSFSSQEYANNYIKTNLSSISTQMSTENNRINEGIEQYNAGQYETALKIFSQLKYNSLILEYQGLCYLQLKKYDAALLSFEQLSADQTILQNKGDFYQAITLMQKGEFERAKTILMVIKNSSEPIFGKNEAINILQGKK